MKIKTGALYIYLTVFMTLFFWGTLALFADSKVLAYGKPLFMVLYMLGGFSPTIAAIVSVRCGEGKGSLRPFFKSVVSFRQSWPWYAALLALPFCFIILIPFLYAGIFTGVWMSLSLPWLTVLFAIPVMIIGGGLEELGWRGVLLPFLKDRLPLPFVLVIIALMWTLWHLPLWAVPGTSQYGTSYLDFFFSVSSYTVVLAALYLGTRSVGMCVVFHALLNSWLSSGFKLEPLSFSGSLTLGSMKLAFAVLFLFAVKRFFKPEYR